MICLETFSHSHYPNALSMKTDLKHSARKIVRERLKEFSPEDILKKSEKAAEHLMSSPEWKQAHTVLMFSSLPSEPQTQQLFGALRKRKGTVVLPRTTWTPGQLVLHSVTESSHLILGKMGFLEPDPDHCPLIELEKIELIITPGIAFDRLCHRLGRGGGYYDRLLATPQRHCPAIGLMFACQEVGTVPVGKHDHPLTAIFTEEGVIRPASASSQ